MSRSRILPSLSSSRQMMIAWKVSGLSHRPAIIASRPASIRLAMAISPSRDRSSTEPISRRYMRTGSSVRSLGSEVRVATAVGRLVSTSSPPSLSSSSAASGGFLFRLFRVLAVDDVDAHLAEHRVHVFDLVGGDLFRRQDGVQLVLRHPAALLGELEQPLDGGVGQIEKGAVGRFDGRGFAFGLRLVLLGHRNLRRSAPARKGSVPVEAARASARPQFHASSTPPAPGATGADDVHRCLPRRQARSRPHPVAPPVRSTTKGARKVRQSRQSPLRHARDRPFAP